ncbi:RloB family protein [Vibrio fluvialis]|nr:RloB family protein [Vibrio fluvialis]
MLYGNGLVSINCIPAAGCPVTIVDSCVTGKKNLEKIAKRSSDPLDKNFQVWAVFDRDQHPNITNAMEKARANGIKIAYSNPCFEIWPYLHFANQTASIHRHALQKKLEGVLDGYDRKSSKKIDLSLLYPQCNYDDAKNRAVSLMNKHHQEATNVVEANPSTNVYKLFDLIIKNGKPTK